MISSCPIQEGLLFEMNHKSNNRYINGTTLSYGIVHILYWTIFCLMVAFASAFLLSRGLSSSRIGLILGVSYLLSALLQPVTGAFFSRHNIPRSRGIAVIYIPVALITVAIRFLPLSGNAVGACMIVLVTVQSMMQPSVNALYQSIETKEEPVNFGMARGMGSVAYALSSFFAGRLLKIFDPSILPLMYLTAQLLLITVLFLIRDNGTVVKSRDRGGNMSYGEMLHRYSHLRFFVLGMICLFLTYSFIDSFLVQIILSIGGTTSDLGTAIMFAAILEMPAMNLILRHPKELLGRKVYARFGAEFPIRFDLLDTMGGQNLSLQVHPTTDYIHRNFGMAYTQDESYYILDADKDACVYLGLKEGVRVEEMIAELEAAQQDGKPFDAEKYINRIPAKKHDHFLIPAGTIHCSGKGAVVLEISATPYIFTFKLWDWGRLGLDGKPRPINIGRGAEVIAERRTEWVRKNLVNPVCTLAENEHYTEEHTGLHELEFIETRRFTIRDRAEIDCHESVNVLNLVEGTACFVESADGSFDPFEVHYAETFIVPECVGKYRLRAVGGPVKVMQAYVRI